MSRSPMIALVLVAASCSGAAQAPAFDGAQAFRWVEHQVAAGPRVPNTPAHRAIGDWLVAELRSRADTVEIQVFAHVTRAGDTLQLRNILARFRPAATSRVLYVSHWDSRPTSDYDPDPALRSRPTPGANDGASSTALLLGVAAALKRRPPPPSLGVDLLFTDGEDYGEFDDGQDVLIGARHFASNLPDGYRPLFAVVWDIVGDPDQRFYQEGHSLDASPEVVERVWSAAREIGLGRAFRNQRGGPVTDDHLPLIEAGIRAINVIGRLEYPWHTTHDTPERISARSLENVGRLALYLVR